MARWEQLRRAILARDAHETEKIWLELVENATDDPALFVEAADLLSRQPGGRRAAGDLLGLLVDLFKERERWLALIPVYGRMAAYAPDDGTVRAGVVEAAHKAYPGRQDIDVLIEKSGVHGGPNAELEEQIATLESFLRIEEDAWVYHKSGWGAGRVVEYHPERGRCVIDFRERPGHEMDIEAAARLLERLAPDDIRVLALSDPRGLRALAKEEPLRMLRQALARYGNSALLRNLRDALVPDAVAPSTWSTWWKAAKKQALLDPRFEVGQGRDPRIEFHDIAQADFSTQVERALRSHATAEGRQKAMRELAAVMGENEEARGVLVGAVERELEITKRPAQRVGWELLLGDLSDRDPMEGLIAALSASSDPVAVVRAIEDDATRGRAARALAIATEEGPDQLMSLALSDDPAAAEVSVEVLPKAGRPELFDQLLKAIDDRPAQLPNLYAWYVRGLRRKRWKGREYEPMPLVLRLLKVLDAVEYRARRKETAADRRAVTRINDLLTEKSCALLHEAADSTDPTAARHVVAMISQNRGLKARARQKLQAVVLRTHPTALREGGPEKDNAGIEAGAQHQIYMTAAGLASLRAAYEKLVNEELPKNAAEIARAREFGDLSENAEYHAARERQSIMQAKADALKADVTRAAVIQADIVRVDAVSVGSRVRLKDAGGHELTYTLFGPPDADVGRGIINYLTPLGQALMGQGEGDQVRLDIDGEVRELEVLGIENGLE